MFFTMLATPWLEDEETWLDSALSGSVWKDLSGLLSVLSAAEKGILRPSELAKYPLRGL